MRTCCRHSDARPLADLARSMTQATLLSKTTALQAFPAPNKGNNNLNQVLFLDSAQVLSATYKTIISGITPNEPFALKRSATAIRIEKPASTMRGKPALNNPRWVSRVQFKNRSWTRQASQVRLLQAVLNLFGIKKAAPTGGSRRKARPFKSTFAFLE